MLYCSPLLCLLNYSPIDIDSYFTLTFRIIGSRHFLPLPCLKKCQSALAYSFIECYSCPWLLPRWPPLSVHPATPFKEGYLDDYEKWLLKKPDVTHYLSIKGEVWANNKFGLLIKVWKGKELPSEVKCHCQSRSELLSDFKGYFSWIASRYLWEQRCPSGSRNPRETGGDFLRHLVDRGWEHERNLDIMSPLICMAEWYWCTALHAIHAISPACLCVSCKHSLLTLLLGMLKSVVDKPWSPGEKYIILYKAALKKRKEKKALNSLLTFHE